MSRRNARLLLYSIALRLCVSKRGSRALKVAPRRLRVLMLRRRAFNLFWKMPSAPLSRSSLAPFVLLLRVCATSFTLAALVSQTLLVLSLSFKLHGMTTSPAALLSMVLTTSLRALRTTLFATVQRALLFLLHTMRWCSWHLLVVQSVTPALLLANPLKCRLGKLHLRLLIFRKQNSSNVIGKTRLRPSALRMRICERRLLLLKLLQLPRAVALVAAAQVQLRAVGSSSTSTSSRSALRLRPSCARAGASAAVVPVPVAAVLAMVTLTAVRPRLPRLCPSILVRVVVVTTAAAAALVAFPARRGALLFLQGARCRRIFPRFSHGTIWSCRMASRWFGCGVVRYNPFGMRAHKTGRS